MACLRVALVSLLLAPATVVADAPRAADRATVQQILDTGLRSNRQSLNAARKLWMQARPKAPHDARLRYAWGLVLRKHSRTTEAERQFLAAAKPDRPAWLPAHQAVIWLKIARGRHADGLKRLDQFVQIVAGRTQPESDRLAAAEWVGRVVAALEILKLSQRETSEMHRVAANAERVFTGTLRAAYDKGMQAVQKLDRDLEVQALKARILARKKDSDRRTRAGKKIAGKQSNIGTSRINLKKTAADWKEWFKERTQETETGLKRLMKELGILEDRRQSLSRSLSLGQAEWNRLYLAARTTARVQANAPRGPARPPGGGRVVNRVAGVGGGASRLEQQMIGYHNRLVATIRQMGQLRKTGTLALRQHRRDVKQYENATGSIVRTNSALSRWEKRLKQQEQKLKTAKLRNPGAGKARKSRVARFSTYVSFDVNKERQTLLKTYAN